ncbi:MAG: (Fe-S)-binding protein [Betaproteobacteria bacterium]|nr:(Fe-S)-binding protein [Betaproteobacteria bacterium]
MSDIGEQHPLECEGPRFGIRKPQTRVDRQGALDDPARVTAALGGFVRDFSRATAAYMDACVHCGQCAEACHFYVTTRDPKYTPIWKLEPFKQAYSRQAGPFACLFRALNLKPEVTIEELEEWQELIYDSCTLCGRCTMICPMGIDIAALGAELREMPSTGDLNWCCGGGGGVVTIHRAGDLRYRAFEIKMRQVEDTGAETLATSCANCRQTFDDGQAHFNWDKKTASLLELVADNLAV